MTIQINRPNQSAAAAGDVTEKQLNDSKVTMMAGNSGFPYGGCLQQRQTFGNAALLNKQCAEIMRSASAAGIGFKCRSRGPLGFLDVAEIAFCSCQPEMRRRERRKERQRREKIMSRRIEGAAAQNLLTTLATNLGAIAPVQSCPRHLRSPNTRTRYQTSFAKLSPISDAVK